MPPLRHGHVHEHQAWSLITRIVTVWPAPDGLWHLGVNAVEPHPAKPVTEEELGRLLQEWGVEVDRWVSWLDSPLWTMRNPFLGTSAGEAWLGRQQQG